MKAIQSKARLSILAMFFSVVMLLSGAALSAHAADENMTDTSTDQNMTETSTEPSMNDTMTEKTTNESTQYAMTPTQQMKQGVEPRQVQCAEGLQLLLKVSNGNAICVSDNTASALMTRGIATQP